MVQVQGVLAEALACTVWEEGAVEQAWGRREEEEEAVRW